MLVVRDRLGQQPKLWYTWFWLLDLKRQNDCMNPCYSDNMRYLKTNKLYCFSPPVMLATLIIELALAVYVVFRYKLNEVSRLVVTILCGLALFQLAEYNVCEGAWGMDSLMWARIGYVVITLLPALGIHLATKLAGEKRPILIGAAYLTAAVFAAIFLFVGHGMQTQECLGNYVIFAIAPGAIIPYTIYYYGWLLVAVYYSWHAGRRLSARPKKKALYSLALGYLSFILPATAANIIAPATLAAIPSIMCGFAVILAVVLATVTVPNYFKKS